MRLEPAMPYAELRLRTPRAPTCRRALAALLRDPSEKRPHLGRGLQVVDPLGRGLLGDELPVSWRQAAVAEPDHPIAAHGAAPHWALLRPSLRSGELAPGEALGHPPVVHEKRQVDVHERVGRREALPRGSDTAKTIDDPLVSAEEVGVDLQVLLVGNLAPARSELDRVQRVERQPCYLGEAPGERGLPATRVAEHRDLPHAVIPLSDALATAAT